MRARHYAPGTGRFLTGDTWGGDVNRPLSLNKWTYVEGNPINYIDPSGHCIFTGIDTVACLIALAVGIPVIAGVTTATWDYSVTQDGGYGGANWSNPGCIDWYQILEAGKGGSLGALNSEGITVASIPLTPAYIMRYLVYGDTPAEVNMDLLSLFGLDDGYSTAQRNPYFYAGQSGGNVGMTYISLATFFKGLPNFRIAPTSAGFPLLQSNGLLANRLILTLPGIEVIGGSRELIYIGTAGMSSQFSMISGNGGSGGQWHHVISNKILRALNDHPILKGVFDREDFVVQASNKLDHSGYQSWHRDYDNEVPTWLTNHPEANRAEFIKYLRSIYSRPSLKKSFPDALDIIK